MALVSLIMLLFTVQRTESRLPDLRVLRRIYVRKGVHLCMRVDQLVYMHLSLTSQWYINSFSVCSFIRAHVEI